jgi:hypothetical protein
MDVVGRKAPNNIHHNHKIYGLNREMAWDVMPAHSAAITSPRTIFGQVLTDLIGRN